MLSGITDYLETGLNFMKAGMNLYQCTIETINGFSEPFYPASAAFNAKEKEKLACTLPVDSLCDYANLALFNKQVTEIGTLSSIKSMLDLIDTIIEQSWQAWINTVTGQENDIRDYSSKLARLMETVAQTYPKKIDEIKSIYGFHLEWDSYVLTAETERFYLYQVLPLNENVKVRKEGKPVLIRHPYVLGANILAFLPYEGKSYVHGFADCGIPTYIMILKNIDEAAPVQIMTGEDDIMDTRYFCEILKDRHDRMVTLNGFCQGGFMAALGVLSGRLNGLVDRLITCVAPMDGSRSHALVDYMRNLPERFRDLNYALKELPNGNKVVDGKVMAWVYKLKSMEKEAPMTTLCRGILDFIPANNNGGIKISNTAAALMNWLKYDRFDLPPAITMLSFLSYTVPLHEEGRLPFTLFGESLSFRDMGKYITGWQVCIASGDDLVDRPAALAPLDYAPEGLIKVTIFPKGHGGIATSHSNLDSEFAVNKWFTYRGENYCGPVRYHLEAEEERAKNYYPVCLVPENRDATVQIHVH
ncbi:MAG: hypothetical protein PHN75_10690 [Syntrophales bacterium]|nr:hypothetical protein [Syntrophales bacterium]